MVVVAVVVVAVVVAAVVVAAVMVVVDTVKKQHLCRAALIRIKFPFSIRKRRVYYILE
jgi:hypothetical protein